MGSHWEEVQSDLRILQISWRSQREIKVYTEGHKKHIWIVLVAVWPHHHWPIITWCQPHPVRWSDKLWESLQKRSSLSGWHTFLLPAWDSWANSHFYGVHHFHSLIVSLRNTSVSVENPYFYQASYRDTRGSMENLLLIYMCGKQVFIYMCGETASDSLVTKCTNLMT